MKNPKLEMIRWADHVTFADSVWRNVDDAAAIEPSIITTIGWVIHEADDRIVIVSSLDNSKTICEGTFCILKGTIQKRWKIREPSRT